LVLGTIVGFGLSPAEAKKPIPWLILICTFIVVFLAFFSWYKDFKSSQLEVRENDGNY
jgi:hypothetical protein